MTIQITQEGVYSTHFLNFSTWFLTNKHNPNLLEASKIFREMSYGVGDNSLRFINNFITGVFDDGLDVHSNILSAFKFFLGYLAMSGMEDIRQALLGAISTLKPVHKAHIGVNELLVYLNTTYNLELEL